MGNCTIDWKGESGDIPYVVQPNAWGNHDPSFNMATKIIDVHVEMGQLHVSYIQSHNFLEPHKIYLHVYPRYYTGGTRGEFLCKFDEHQMRADTNGGTDSYGNRAESSFSIVHAINAYYVFVERISMRGERVAQDMGIL